MKTGTKATLAVLTGALTTTATFLLTAALSPIPAPTQPVLRCSGGSASHPGERICHHAPVDRPRELSSARP
ncbi:hypothetical protein ACIBQ1_41475 [Nonomuraea sp. NPDC050153]|uniref:hypothetical protein n=1 Tax=Nonomuraea sp. NPDC050153 TaxID=3364359 RepID=UPI0037A78AA9